MNIVPGIFKEKSYMCLKNNQNVAILARRKSQEGKKALCDHRGEDGNVAVGGIGDSINHKKISWEHSRDKFLKIAICTSYSTYSSTNR